MLQSPVGIRMGAAARRAKKRPPTSIYGMGSLEGIGKQTTPLAGTSASKVSTASPYTGSQMRQYSAVKPVAANYGMGSGDRTRQAYGQAMASRQSNEYRQAMEDAARDQQGKAEKARAADVYAQRAEQVRRYGLNEGYKADRRGIELAQDEEARNIRSRVLEAKRNRDSEMRSGIIGSLFGGGLLSAGGNAWIARRQGSPFFGGLFS